MAFGQPLWIAAHLLGESPEATSIDGVRVSTVLFGTTSGPFEGIGGAAMTPFVMTLLASRDSRVFVFADETLLGWAEGERASAVLAEWDKRGGYTRGVRALLEPAALCPVPHLAH